MSLFTQETETASCQNRHFVLQTRGFLCGRDTKNYRDLRFVFVLNVYMCICIPSKTPAYTIYCARPTQSSAVSNPGDAFRENKQRNLKRCIDKSKWFSVLFSSVSSPLYICHQCSWHGVSRGRHEYFVYI